MRTSLTLILLMSMTSLFGQSNEIIAPFFENGKWGFMNEKKEIIVEPKYEEAYPSRSSRYRVKTKGKYGYIDGKGKLVIKTKYRVAEDFKNGIAEVKKKKDFIYINEKGERNTTMFAMCGTHYNCHKPIMSNRIEIVHKDDRLGIVHDRKRTGTAIATLRPDTIGPMFDSIVPITHQLMALYKDSLMAFSHEGDYYGGPKYVLDNLKFEYQDFQQFHCNLCGDGKNEYIGVKKNGLWGYMRIYVTPIDHIEAKYHSISSLADGFALVEYREGKFGYIDSKGTEYFIR